MFMLPLKTELGCVIFVRLYRGAHPSIWSGYVLYLERLSLYSFILDRLGVTKNKKNLFNYPKLRKALQTFEFHLLQLPMTEKSSGGEIY